MSETLSVLLLRFFPLSLMEQKGIRLVLVEQSAVGGFPWSLSHTEDRKRQWDYCLQAPMEIISHTQEVFFLPLKKKP